MNSKHTLHEFACSLLSNIGPTKTHLLLSKFDDLNAFFTLMEQEIATKGIVDKRVIKKINRSLALYKAQEELALCQDLGIQNIFYQNKHYPFFLKQCPDAPINLFVKGNLDLRQKRLISIVGTRNPSNYGISLLNELLSELQKIPDIVIVSGLAYGIDIAAHRLCITHGIPNIAVLGHGFHFLYPSIHKKEAKAIQENGLLMTEFPFYTTPAPYNFPRRNRIIAGLSEATIIVESKISGGSLITARQAFDYNREVFAFPGSIFSSTSQGCNQLIKKGIAQTIENAEDFINSLALHQVPKTSTTIHFDSQEHSALMTLLERDHAISMDELHVKSGIPLRKMSQILLELELDGHVTKQGQNTFLKN